MNTATTTNNFGSKRVGEVRITFNRDTNKIVAVHGQYCLGCNATRGRCGEFTHEMKGLFLVEIAGMWTVTDFDPNETVKPEPEDDFIILLATTNGKGLRLVASLTTVGESQRLTNFRLQRVDYGSNIYAPNATLKADVPTEEGLERSVQQYYTILKFL